MYHYLLPVNVMAYLNENFKFVSKESDFIFILNMVGIQDSKEINPSSKQIKKLQCKSQMRVKS